MLPSLSMKLVASATGAPWMITIGPVSANDVDTGPSLLPSAGGDHYPSTGGAGQCNSGSVPRRYGCFDLSWGKARYTGSNRLVCDVTDGSDAWTGAMAVSDDGRWAACSGVIRRCRC